VALATAEEAAWEAWERRVSCAGLVSGLGGAGDLVSVAAVVELTRHLTWTPLQVADGSRAVVPAGARGWVRLSWRADRPGRERLAVELTDDAGSPVQRLEVPVVFVPAVQVYPRQVDLGEWDADGPAPAAELWCWSATRDDVPLTVAGDSDLEAAVRRLSPGEARHVQQTLGQQGISTRVRAGWAVTVRPRVGDLGPFERVVRLDSPALLEPLDATVVGRVRGEVSVAADEQGRIDLGAFPSERGARRQVAVTAPPEARLTVAGRVPDYLAAELTAIEPGRWQLSVAVPPDRVTGPLPAGSAVTVRLAGEPGRRLHIPVIGQAYR
jgi:hypothetical protein